MTAAVQPVWGAVIVAAGSSSRFGRDKLLEDLGGAPVILRSIEAMAAVRRFSSIVVVGSSTGLVRLTESIGPRFHSVCVRWVEGGATRSDSVRNGVKALSEDVTHVAVHDGARPLVPQRVVAAVLDATERNGAAIPVTAPASTITVRSSQGTGMAGTLDRERLAESQTPQAARRDWLDAAMSRFPGETDESTALFRAGYPVEFVPGAPVNIKLTVPADLAIARALYAGDWAEE